MHAIGGKRNYYRQNIQVTGLDNYCIQPCVLPDISQHGIE